MAADDDPMATDVDMAPVELSDGRAIELHEAHRDSPGEFGVGAYRDGEIVGILVCEADELANGHLNVFVKPAWRNVGVGTALVRYMTERAGSQGLAYLTLSFGVANDAASRMLAGSGLVVARRIRAGVEKAAVYVPRPRVAA
jgi:ribosomal protein S18 acetylase RimI-like enzyme